MNHLRGNWLLLRIAAVYALYIIVAPWIPKPHVFNGVAIIAAAGGTVLFARYAQEAWNILWRQERGQWGAHHAVLGAAEVGLGLMYSGVFRLVYNHFGQPETWQATWFSSLGLLMIAKGVFRQSTSPTDNTMLAGFPQHFWNWLLIAICILMAFLAGTQFGGHH